jgi:hypothetical protein
MLAKPDRRLILLPILAAFFAAASYGAQDRADEHKPAVVIERVRDLAAFSRTELEKRLAHKLDDINRICRPSDDQKQKLELAGRGDIKTLLDRVEALKRKSQSSQPGDNTLDELLEENESLKRLVRSGPFEDGSKLAKIQSRVLTKEQLAKLMAFDEIQRLGGRVKTRPQGPEMEVHLARTRFSDDDFAHLPALTDIVALDLSQTKFTDSGLAHLKKLTKLRALELGNTPITDSGLYLLKDMTSLETLDLDKTQVTSSGLAYLKGLTRLEHLTLSSTAVTDAGLVHLKGLKELRMLDLSRTGVTDTGLQNLRGISSLRVVSLGRTGVTEAGIAELKRALPRANMSR